MDWGVTVNQVLLIFETSPYRFGDTGSRVCENRPKGYLGLTGIKESHKKKVTRYAKRNFNSG